VNDFSELARYINFRFAGQYYDEETGLHYNYFRYYDPKTGRYLTPDPIGLAGGTNLCTYAGNNPVNAIDPYGLEFFLIGRGDVIVRPSVARTIPRITRGMQRNTPKPTPKPNIRQVIEPPPPPPPPPELPWWIRLMKMLNGEADFGADVIPPMIDTSATNSDKCIDTEKTNGPKIYTDENGLYIMDENGNNIPFT
jgi:RHS repeat-associated protein